MEEIRDEAWIREMEKRARVLEILYGMGEANKVKRLERMIESRERMIARVDAMRRELEKLKKERS